MSILMRFSPGLHSSARQRDIPHGHQKPKSQTQNLPPSPHHPLHRRNSHSSTARLQRIGFNDKLFAILRRAYNKRAERAISKSYPEPAPLDVNMELFGDFTEECMASAWGPVSTTPKKRARAGEGDDDEEEPEGRESTSGKAGSSKVPRLGEFAELDVDFF